MSADGGPVEIGALLMLEEAVCCSRCEGPTRFALGIAVRDGGSHEIVDRFASHKEMVMELCWDCIEEWAAHFGSTAAVVIDAAKPRGEAS